MIDDRPVLICAPQGAKQRASIAGSTVDVCEDCGQPVWLSPSGQRIKEQQNAILVCTPCGVQSIAANPDTTIGELNGDQLRELRNHQMSG